jgi:3',5'-cyclic AMP phosphodiesterase CpdA
VTPILIAQLSDPHLRLAAGDASGPELARAVRRVLALDPLPVAVLVTGDIANDGDPREHAFADELLAPLPMPVHRLAGNHDLLGRPLRYAVDAGPLRIVACDTSRDGRDDGDLDLDWLAARLREVPDRPTIVAMHHPPIDIGLPWLDEIGLPATTRAALADLLAASPHVKRVVAGHVHRTVTGTLGGCPVVTCTSTNIQAGLEFTTAGTVLANEPPSILVHALLATGELVTHVQPT